jgi:hypothetical protein
LGSKRLGRTTNLLNCSKNMTDSVEYDRHDTELIGESPIIARERREYVGKGNGA